MKKAKAIRLVDIGNATVIKDGIEITEKDLQQAKVEQPGAQINGTLSYARFVLKEANFLKKSGFYYKALEMIDTLLDYMDEELKAESSLKLKHKAMPQLQLKFRVHRDRARVLALLNRNEESMKAFDKAEKCIELTASNLGAESIKYAKMYYIKGLAARRISSSKAENFFDYAIDFFA